MARGVGGCGVSGSSILGEQICFIAHVRVIRVLFMGEVLGGVSTAVVLGCCRRFGLGVGPNKLHQLDRAGELKVEDGWKEESRHEYLKGGIESTVSEKREHTKVARVVGAQDLLGVGERVLGRAACGGVEIQARLLAAGAGAARPILACFWGVGKGGNRRN